jgi:AraC-like DNA-binding protein
VPSSDYAKSLGEWQRIIASSFVPMRVVPHPAAGDEYAFTGTVTRTVLGSVGLSVVDSGPHIARRTEADIRLHPADFYKVSVQLSGVTRLLQNGRESVLEVGEAAIYDVTQPYELEFAIPSRSIVVQIPGTEFAVPRSSVAAVTAVPFRLSGGLMCLLEAPFEAEGYDAAPAGAAYHRGLALSHLLAAELIGFAQLDASDTDRAHVWADIERYVAAHLSNPELGPEDVARANFLSRRSLQRVFAEAGTTFSGWLREKRLERAHARLLTTSDAVAVVARECGFSSAQHFSHAFRDRYGITARDLRRNRGAESA